MSSNRSSESPNSIKEDANRWIALSGDVLPIDKAMNWAVDPACGAVVSFSGTVRNHSEGRPGVTMLDYEAYEEFALPKISDIVDKMFQSWPQVHKVAVLHRIGPMKVAESSVFIVVSAEHRESAFQAAKFCIDTIKTSVPIWKKEQWSKGSDWGSDPHDIVAIEEL